MDIIKVNTDDTLCDNIEEVKDYVDLLNGIVYDCVHGAYSRGRRNTIAVDLTVAACTLGLDPLVILEEFEKANLIDAENDDESPRVRVLRVLEYHNSFSWDWMIDPDEYLDLGREATGKMPIMFDIA